MLWALGLLIVMALIGLVMQLSKADSSLAAGGRVWSEEHGHWHTAAPVGAGSAPRPLRPTGPAPPGKVWSAEHGHWHDVQ